MQHTKFISKLTCVLLAFFLAGSCNMIEYHPYDGNVTGNKHLTVRNIARIEALCKDKDTIRVVQISDTQRWYDETEAIVRGINKLGNIDFVIHTGDMSDFGLTKEFEWQRDILQGLNMPFVCVIGNHDCLGTGEDTYHYIFGEDNFSFNAGFLHVVCLNTNAFEYDYSDNVPDFGFIKKDYDSIPEGVTRTIVAMHAGPECEQFNNNVAEFFDYSLKKYPGLTFCMCGHDHQTKIYYPFGKETPYYECTCAKNKAFLVFTITRNGYTYEEVQL